MSSVTTRSHRRAVDGAVDGHDLGAPWSDGGQAQMLQSQPGQLLRVAPDHLGDRLAPEVAVHHPYEVALGQFAGEVDDLVSHQRLADTSEQLLLLSARHLECGQGGQDRDGRCP